MFMASVLYGKIGDNAYLNSYSEEFGIPPQDPSISNNFFICFSQESLALFVLNQLLTSLHLLCLQRQDFRIPVFNFESYCLAQWTLESIFNDRLINKEPEIGGLTISSHFPVFPCLHLPDVVL